jgi:hypothetical protein
VAASASATPAATPAATSTAAAATATPGQQIADRQKANHGQHDQCQQYPLHDFTSMNDCSLAFRVSSPQSDG